MSETITLRQWVTMDAYGTVVAWEDDKEPEADHSTWRSGSYVPGELLINKRRELYVNACGLTPMSCVPVDVTITVKRRGPRYRVIPSHGGFDVTDSAGDVAVAFSAFGPATNKAMADACCEILNAASEAGKAGG